MIFPNKMLSKKHSDTSEDEMSPSKPKRTRKLPPKDTEEYRARRARNNVAVRKSREQTRAKAKATMERVNFLKSENEKLEGQLTTLSKELSVLKDLFKMVHTNGTDTVHCALPNTALSEPIQTVKPEIKEEQVAIPETTPGIPEQAIQPVGVAPGYVDSMTFEVTTAPMAQEVLVEEAVVVEEPPLVIDAGFITTDVPLTPVNTEALRKDHEYSRFSK